MTTPAAPQYCLIVDDEPRLRQVMAHLMRADGFQCVEASNGVEALEQLAAYPFSLVLSDKPIVTGHARSCRLPLRPQRRATI